ncbi:MAG: GNAT family N-acetyltransferase [Candidatus Cloacimonetes bacterium]|nr:GNAT family N-acetyltransferase [Candidatus Cloacimonadota bacterium]
MSNNVSLKKPVTEDEFSKYYEFRWRILRKPWERPKGTEKDNKEEKSIHIMAVLNNKIVGCGRAHFNSKDQVQIRYMAVDKQLRGQKIGTKILLALEKEIKKIGAQEIILNARSNAVSLYRKNGYETYKEGDILFGEIKHYWMRKWI